MLDVSLNNQNDIYYINVVNTIGISIIRRLNIKEFDKKWTMKATNYPRMCDETCAA